MSGSDTSKAFNGFSTQEGTAVLGTSHVLRKMSQSEN